MSTAEVNNRTLSVSITLTANEVYAMRTVPIKMIRERAMKSLVSHMVANQNFDQVGMSVDEYHNQTFHFELNTVPAQQVTKLAAELEEKEKEVARLSALVLKQEKQLASIKNAVSRSMDIIKKEF